MLIYTVLFILLLTLLLRYVQQFKIDGLSNWTIPLAFLIKIAVGLVFNYLHEQTYGKGDLSHDGGTFLLEGKFLNDVFYQSPLHYFQLLTGIGENEALIKEHLSMTKYWSAGDLTVINDSKNVIRVHSLIHFISGGSMYIHISLMCLISLMAVKNLYYSFRDKVKLTNTLFFWILLLIPSTIFWTSSILKEPILFFGLSLFVRALLYENQSWKKAILLFLAILILVGFKPYVLICILIALACYGVYRYLFRYRLALTLLFLIASTVVFGFLLEKPRETMVHNLTRKQFDFVNVGKGGLHAYADTCFYYFQPHQYPNLLMEGDKVILLKETDAYIFRFGSTQKPIPVHLVPKGEVWEKYYFAQGCASFIETTPLNHSTIQLIKNIPEALINSILRPFPNDPGSKLKFLSVLEIWIIILFMLLALRHRRKLNQSEKGLVFILLIFALTLSLLIGWTTPVLGAIARYRFPAQLAIILVGLILLKPFKIKSWKNIFS